MSSPTTVPAPSPNHNNDHQPMNVVETVQLTFHKKQPPQRLDALKLIKLKVREGNEAKRKARGGLTLLKDGIMIDDYNPDDHQTLDDIETDGMKIINAAAQHLQNIEWERRSPVKKILMSEKLEKKLVVTEEETEEEEKQEEIPIDEEFITGTVIFYRSILSLQQAKHKGFLTYEWVEEPAEDHTIAAFERKISIDAVSKITNPASTHFEILNTTSLFDESSVKYGDVVYLVVAGRYVLGSQYNGLVNAFGHRNLNPGIIKCSLRGNIADMTIQQYSTSIERTDAGRWIILNKDDPIGKHGTVVRHGDRIMLEQEFYYLSSSSPAHVALERTRWSLEDVWKRNPDLDFFGMTEECCWLTHLVHQKNLGTTDTRKGAVVQLRAVHQLDSSMGARSQARRTLFGRMNELVDSSTEFDQVQQNLQHKMNEKSDKQHLLELYSTMSRKMFQRYYRSMSANQLAASSSRWHSKPPEDQEVAPATTETGQEGALENVDGVDPNDSLHDAASTAIDFESISILPTPNHTEFHFFGEPQKAINEFEKGNIGIATMTKNASVHFTPLPTLTGGRNSPTRRRRSRKEILTPAQQHELELNNMQAEYWKQAQQLRVNSSAWEELPAIKKYHDGPRERARLKAAILIQRFVRRTVNFSGISRRSLRNADSKMYMRLAMMKKMDWREEFMQTLQARRKNETEQQKKRDLESSYFFATAAKEKSAVDGGSASVVDAASGGGIDAASSGIDANVLSSLVHTDEKGGEVAEGPDDNMRIEEETTSSIPNKNTTVASGSLAISSPPTVSARQSKRRNERTLHDACKLGKLTSVQAFVAKQVDINEFDRHGVTPIFYAVAKGHLEVARYLANHGAGGVFILFCKCFYFFHLGVFPFFLILDIVQTRQRDRKEMVIRYYTLHALLVIYLWSSICSMNVSRKKMKRLIMVPFP